MRCKPGDMAVIIRIHAHDGHEFWKNLGLVVRVIEWQEAYMHETCGYCHAGWIVYSSGRMLRSASGLSRRAVMLDSALKPIRPDPSSLEESRSVRKPQPVNA